MDNPAVNRNASKTITNQPTRKKSNQNDLLAKIRPLTPNKPNLVQHLSQSNSIQMSSGLKILSTRIQSNADPSYQPLVMISDDNDSEEDNFVSPVHRLTKNELREELKTFRQNEESTRNKTNYALLAHENDDDDDEDAGDIEFRTQQSIKRTICCYQYPFSLKERFCAIS